VQKTAFLGDRNEITEMSKFHLTLLSMPYEHR
jgi:hypothetical protein